jgi:hypothetical protein
VQFLLAGVQVAHAGIEVGHFGPAVSPRRNANEG